MQRFNWLNSTFPPSMCGSNDRGSIDIEGNLLTPPFTILFSCPCLHLQTNQTGLAQRTSCGRLRLSMLVVAFTANTLALSEKTKIDWRNGSRFLPSCHKPSLRGLNTFAKADEFQNRHAPS